MELMVIINLLRLNSIGIIKSSRWWGSQRYLIELLDWVIALFAKYITVNSLYLAKVFRGDRRFLEQGIFS